LKHTVHDKSYISFDSRRPAMLLLLLREILT